jgi:hypothetical protein
MTVTTSIEIPVYIALQQTDLHCISAFEAIRHSLNYEALVSLRRYRVLTFDVMDHSPSWCVNGVTQYLNRAFDVLNPNKEAAVVGTFPSIPPIEGTITIAVAVRNSDERLTRLEAPSLQGQSLISRIRQELVWVLSVRTDGRSNDVVLKEAERVCVPSYSRTQGLLVNPLFETYSVTLIS